MSVDPPIRVLFVCTGNSCRSIMAEALLREHGGADFEVHSAGTHAKGLNKRTLRLLDEVGFDSSWARSTPVEEYVGEAFDYVVTVCDRAREVCPVFPGASESLHWGYDDPAEVIGTEQEIDTAYRHTFTAIGERIGLFIPLALRTRQEADAATTSA